MCTVLLPPGVNPIAGNKYIEYEWNIPFYFCVARAQIGAMSPHF